MSNSPNDWLADFHTISELEAGRVRMLIEGIMPEGVNFIGSLAGVGKTYVSLSMAHAVVTGDPFLGVFKVIEPTPVLYLVPEMGGRSFRERCEKMHIPDSSMFLCRTLRDGVMKLTDRRLLDAVSELRPVVFLDSAIRFISGDESSASENAMGLANGVFELLRLGAPAVQCLHHSPKFAGKEFTMTLENVLRGTGDFGAMCDSVWGLENSRRRKGSRWDREYAEESKQLTRITMGCVKARDFEPAEQLVIQGKPYIDEKGDFEIISQDGVSKSLPSSKQQQRLDTMLEMIRKDSHVSVNRISKATGWNAEAVKSHAAGAGYRRNDENAWIKGGAAVTGADLLEAEVTP
jgi:hypothetical protein